MHHGLGTLAIENGVEQPSIAMAPDALMLPWPEGSATWCTLATSVFRQEHRLHHGLGTLAIENGVEEPNHSNGSRRLDAAMVGAIGDMVSTLVASVFRQELFLLQLHFVE